MFITGPNIDALISHANRTLNIFREWTERNFLKVNAQKTKAVIFKTRNTRVDRTLDMHLGNSNIEFVDTFKSLGVIFSEGLTWNKHVDYICMKIRKTIGIVNKERYILPLKVKKIIYNSLIYSQISYCHLVWGTTTCQNKSNILTLQKKYVRIMANVPRYTTTVDLFIKYDIIKIDMLYNFLLIKRYQDSIRRNNTNFINMLKLKPREIIYTTRSTDIWTVPRSRTSYGTQLLTYNIAVLLNKLTDNVTIGK